jgi:hypothetical protein
MAAMPAPWIRWIHDLLEAPLVVAALVAAKYADVTQEFVIPTKAAKRWNLVPRGLRDER